MQRPTPKAVNAFELFGDVAPQFILQSWSLTERTVRAHWSLFSVPVVAKDGLSMGSGTMDLPNSCPDMQLWDAGLPCLREGWGPWCHCTQVREKHCCYLWAERALAALTVIVEGGLGAWVLRQSGSQIRGNGMKGTNEEELSTAVVNWLLFITVQSWIVSP